MSNLNRTLLKLAQHIVRNSDTQQKQAVVAPPGPGGDPAAGAVGMPPGGGMPPAPAGMPPPGGMPPGMDPSMMGMAPPQVGIPASPNAAPPAAPAPAASAPAVPKIKVEDWMPNVNMQLYGMQQQLAAIMTGLKLQLPPSAVTVPPGPTPPTLAGAIQSVAPDQAPPGAPPTDVGAQVPPDPAAGGMPPGMLPGMPPEGMPPGMPPGMPMQ